MRRDSHDCSRTVGHHDILSNPDRDARLINRVNSVATGEDAGFFFVGGLAFDIRLAGCLRQAFRSIDFYSRLCINMGMKKQIKTRLEDLRSEFEAGQKTLAELEAKAENIRETLLRISGAIQVLEEELEKADQQLADESKP